MELGLLQQFEMRSVQNPELDINPVVCRSQDAGRDRGRGRLRQGLRQGGALQVRQPVLRLQAQVIP